MSSKQKTILLYLLKRLVQLAYVFNDTALNYDCLNQDKNLSEIKKRDHYNFA